MAIKKHQQKSVIQEVLDRKKIKESGLGNFMVSFADYDSSQEAASSFSDWERMGLLAHSLDVFKGYCCSTLESQINTEKFTRYGDFPPSNRTKFIHPKHVTEDADWARIHINGKSIIAGHVVRNVFYVVFLDSEHNFYMTKNAAGEK